MRGRVARRNIGIGAVLFAGLAMPAMARDYCPERPGLDTAPCILDPGRFSLEVGAIDWERDSDPDTREDRVLAGDAILRYGIASHGELRLGWTAYGHDSVRDRATGNRDRAHGTGDVTLGIKRNVHDPDGEGLSVALLPFVRLPVGGHAVGDGTWSASFLLPVSVALSKSVQIVLTPEIDAAADEDRHGRHIAYGSAGGLQIAATDRLDLSLEAMVLRDDDPEGHATEALASAAVAVKLGEETQLDAGGAFALDHAAPDNRLYLGVSRRF